MHGETLKLVTTSWWPQRHSCCSFGCSILR